MKSCWFFLLILHQASTALVTWDFGVDSRDLSTLAIRSGNIGAFKKLTQIDLDVGNCTIINFVHVEVHNLLSTPTVTYNEDTQTVSIAYDVIGLAKSNYEIVAKGRRKIFCNRSVQYLSATTLPDKRKEPGSYYGHPPNGGQYDSNGRYKTQQDIYRQKLKSDINNGDLNQDLWMHEVKPKGISELYESTRDPINGILTLNPYYGQNDKVFTTIDCISHCDEPTSTSWPTNYDYSIYVPNEPTQNTPLSLNDPDENNLFPPTNLPPNYIDDNQNSISVDDHNLDNSYVDSSKIQSNVWESPFSKVKKTTWEETMDYLFGEGHLDRSKILSNVKKQLPFSKVKKTTWEETMDYLFGEGHADDEMTQEHLFDKGQI